MFKNLLFKLNDRFTRKGFTHVNGDGGVFYTVATPEDFFNWAAKMNWDVFKMACLQSYVQLGDGKWRKGCVIPFKNRQMMLDVGIKRIDQ